MSDGQLDVHPEDALLDDSTLLADRLLRSLHRNKDGHLGPNTNRHVQAVSRQHNVAVLFLYTQELEEYTMHEHYVYSSESLNYQSWRKVVLEEVVKIEKYTENLYGIYGWSTASIKITPLRNGDLFIKVDADGARGVRLAFDTRKTKRKARHETKSKTSGRRSNRNRQ